MITASTAAAEPHDNSAFVENVCHTFRHRAQSGMLRLVRGHPAARSARPPEPLLQAIEGAGRRALTRFLTQTGAADAQQCEVALDVLALLPLPFALFSPEALTDAPPDGDAATIDVDPDDVATFACTLLDRDPGRRVDPRPEVLPASWQSFVDQVAPGWLHPGAPGTKPPAGAGTALMRGALLAIGRGYWAVGDVPADADVVEWAIAAGWDGRTVREWRQRLERLDAWLPAAVECADTPGAERCLRRVLASVRAHREAERPRTLAAVIEQVGYHVPPLSAKQAQQLKRDADRIGLQSASARRAVELVTRVAPHIARLVTTSRIDRTARAPATTLREPTAVGLLDTLSRLLAQALLHDPTGSLAALTPADLFRRRMPADQLLVRPSALADHEFLEANLGRPLAPPDVPYVHFLLDQQAPRSAARSPAAVHHDPNEPLIYTPTLLHDSRAISHAFRRVVLSRVAPGSDGHDELAELTRIAAAVEPTMRDSNGDAGDRLTVKQMEELVGLITYPQLVCLGLPFLRARVLDLLARLTARPRFGVAPVTLEHYFEWLEIYVVMAICCADPIRIKNWVQAWLRSEIHLVFDKGDGQHRLAAAQSSFAANGHRRNRAASMKVATDVVWRRSGPTRQTRPPRLLHWPPNVVDPVLLQDYVERLRTRRLQTRLGAGAYTLTRELAGKLGREKYLPLFVTPAAASKGRHGNPHAMSTPTFRVRFAQGLHWICRDVLGRDLPPWWQFKRRRDARWYGLFCPHAVRGLMVTYLLGARAGTLIGDAFDAPLRARLQDAVLPANHAASIGARPVDVACRLSSDKEATLRDSYLFWPPELAAQLLAPTRDWTDPTAFDVLMDRIFCGDPVPIDWPVALAGLLPLGRQVNELVVP